MSYRTLVNRHLAVFPGPHFTACDGETMSSTNDNRAWDMLWRCYRARNNPTWKRMDCDIFCELGLFPDYETPRKEARQALRRLKSWYYEPTAHSFFNCVH